MRTRIAQCMSAMSEPNHASRLGFQEITSFIIYTENNIIKLLYILDRYETNKYGCVINKKLLGAILILFVTIDK